MTEPVWLSQKAVVAVHEALIARTGGSSGILNYGMLDSTLNKAKNVYYYGENPSIARLAAVYGYGFIKNHCFVDGNKRIALASVSIFLIRNGFRLTASEVEAARFFLELASAMETQDEGVQRLSDWIGVNVKQLQ